MRFFTSILFFISVFSSNAQNLKEYFGQAVFHSDDKQLITSVEEKIRANDRIKLVRIDPTNGNVLLFTKPLESWGIDDLSALFEQYSDKLGCLYVGINRKDSFKTFPFEDCK